ncbi:MAG: UvrD-helicase domain-containing protein [Buchnera aphidicola (Meitanaphis elongallis)]
MDLNVNQNKAVRCISGPCLILAGAGSGKTQVIINKIIYLIKKCNFNPSSIFAVTFTNRAANEMKNRISNRLSISVMEKITISTFHTLGLEIIKSELSQLKIQPNFSIFDEQDQTTVLKNITQKKDKIFLKNVRLAISNWKNKLINSHNAKINAKSDLEKNHAYYYELYERYLKSCNILDFDDLVFIPTLLLKNDELLRKKWDEKVRYFLVDEYQDTNNIQYELIKLLNKHVSDFTLVGDDDQSIYSWRGARVRNFSLLQSDYPTLNIIKLEHNYRSSGRILKAANLLITNNPHFLKKKLFSNLEYGPIINVISAKNEEEEAKLVLKKILIHKSLNLTKFQDYAILYRSNYQVKIFEKILMNFKVPYYISARSSFFSCSEVKDLLAYLKLILNPNDDVAFLKIINRPSRGIGNITLKKLKEWSKKRRQSLFFSSNDMGLRFILPSRNFNALKSFVILINNLIKDIYIRPATVLNNLISIIEYDVWLSKTIKNAKIYEISINNIRILLSWISELIEKYKYTNRPNFFSEIVVQFIIQNELKNENFNDNKIQLMTLHASKGLEFSYVFMIGMEEGILPHYNSISNNIDEERRLTYVGITRAKKELCFSYSETRYQYGEIIHTIPSRFLLELPKNDLSWNKDNIKKKSSNFNKDILY